MEYKSRQTAVISSCNSGVYATGRVLSALAQRGQAPRALGQLDERRLPIPAITASVVPSAGPAAPRPCSRCRSIQ